MPNYNGPPQRNHVERISDALENITARLSRIEERLDAVADAYRDGHAEDFEYQNYLRMAGHVGYTDATHNHNVKVFIADVKGQPISIRHAIVQTRSGVDFHFGDNPMPTLMLGHITVEIQ